MRALILGGTWSLGQLIACGCVDRGIEVTVFNRGRRGPATADGVRFVQGDRTVEADLRRLARSGPWDVVVDIGGKVPAIVRRSVGVLADSAEVYVSVSAQLVYRDWPHAPVTETSPLHDGDPGFDPGPWEFEPGLYGRMKAGCEAAGREAFGDDRVLILRLHEMIGQREDDGALAWWLARARRGGRILVPAPDRAIQPIDVRDVASFTVDLIVRRVTGVLNVGAPPRGRTFGALVLACAEIAAGASAGPAELVWADEDWLAGQGVREWRELPLWWRAAAPWDVSVERAVALGLRCRPLHETAASTWGWMAEAPGWHDHPRFSAYGMDPAREARLVADWIATSR